MKLLITGGCGYVGSELIKSLLKSDHKIINIDTFIEKNNKINEFYYFDKKIRSLYYKNFIKHPLSSKLPWYCELKRYFDNNDLL